MTPTYQILRRHLGPRRAAVLTTIIYAFILVAIVLTFGSGSAEPIPYLDQ